MKSKLALCATISLASFCANATGFPEKPITIITPFPAGSSSDLIPRMVAPLVSKKLGVPVVVDNKPGANGSLGAASVATAKADGHTILLATTGVLAINQWIYDKPRYQPERDFTPIVNAASTSNLLVAHPSVPASTLKELVDLAKQKPGTVTFGSAGYGSTSHLCGEVLKQSAGVDMSHVPYKGPAPALQDLLGGSVMVMCDNLSNVINYVNTGKLKAIAITDTQRSPLLPNVPTTKEAGFPDVQAGIWYGFVAPSQTPGEVITQLNVAIEEALRAPEVQNRLKDLGLAAIGGSPESFKTQIQVDAQRMKRVVEISGAKVD